MTIHIDNTPITPLEGESILECALRLGIHIPSMCCVRTYKHAPSCMVCMVRDERTGAMMPACSTFPEDGMRIDASSGEVLEMRRLALELLLSDHRADCEAPCSTVCPAGLDIEGMLYYFDKGERAASKAIIKSAFRAGEPLPCTGTCKRPCEKVCRRGGVDAHVQIVKIIETLLSDSSIPSSPSPLGKYTPSPKGRFSSRIGRFSEEERKRLAGESSSASRCLHCACEKRDGCHLRDLATELGIRTPSYGVTSSLPFKVREHIRGRLYFESAKCIHCGLCVYNTVDAFTFKGRGFGMQVVLPEESRTHVDESIAALCPTGALSLSRE